MFEKCNLFTVERNNRIWEIITGYLNTSILENLGFAFSGGALFSMRYGEYRTITDIDFMCPLGYKNSVNTLNPSSFCYLPFSSNKVSPERFIVNLEYENEKIKLDFFEQPDPEWETDRFNGILSTSPCFSIIYKLMANARRGFEGHTSDRNRYRDIIDLTMLYKYHPNLFRLAWHRTINMSEVLTNKLLEGTEKSLVYFNIDIAIEILGINPTLSSNFKENYKKLKNEIIELSNGKIR